MKTVKLECGQWTAEILPEWGMNVISLTFDGTPIFRTPKNEEELLKTPFLFGTPLLFPAGRTPDGVFHAGNREYRLPINEPSRNNHLHGVLHKAPFVITDKSEAKLTGEYLNDGGSFPIKFDLVIKYTLSETGLKSEYVFTNTDFIELPVVFALHTAFTTPSNVKIGIGGKYLLNDRKIAVGQITEKNEYEIQLLTGLSPEGVGLSGLFEMTGPAMLEAFIYKASEPFRFWTVYNGNGSDGYICIEPQCGIGLETDGNRHTLYLRPGQSVAFSTVLEKL